MHIHVNHIQEIYFHSVYEFQTMLNVQIYITHCDTPNARSPICVHSSISSLHVFFVYF